MSTLLYVVDLVCYHAALSCANILTTDSGGPMIFTTLSNSILMLRVHALYNRNPHRKRTLVDDSSMQ